jgi:hypothetical protein
MHAYGGINPGEPQCGLEHRDDNDATSYAKKAGEHTGDGSRRKHGNTKDEPLFHLNQARRRSA